MPCYQSATLPAGVTTTGRTPYATEAECLQACKEGACCDGTTCAIRPKCECDAAGKVFLGIGTLCSPNPCAICDNCCPEFLSTTVRRQVGLLYDLTFNETCPDAFGGLNTTFVLSRSTVAANLQTTVAPQFRTPCDFFDLATQPPTSGFVTDPAGAVTNIPSFIPSLIRSYTTRLSIVGGCAAQAEITVFFETPCASSYSVVLLSPAISFSNQSSCMDGVSFPLSSTAAVFAGGRNVSLAISGTVDVSGNPLP